jgi:hypothetical protein
MTACIGRRDFITLLGGATAAWPLAARGQNPAQKSHEFLLWHEASTEEAVIYLGADLSCRQNATHSRDIDWLLNHPLGRPCP